MQLNKPVEIVKGLYQISVPVPIPSLKKAFVYLARDGEENLLIDTGWNSEESYAALRAGFSDMGFSMKEIQNVVVSHLHPDHFGLSPRIKREALKSKLLMHRADAHVLLKSVADRKGFLSRLENWMLAQGTPREVLNEMMDSSSPLSEFSIPIPPDVKLNGGEMINVGKKFRFEVISTPGHTIGNICLYEYNSKVLFSGDHILPTITPNVSLSPLYEGDPLGDYLNSLDVLKDVKASKVLPSHEYVFRGLQRRVKEIRKHHSERLKDTMHALNSGKEPMSTYKVASMLHWYTGSWEKLSAWEKRAAVMETAAHLAYLKRRGKITEIEEGPKDTSRVLYATIAKR